MYSITFTHRVTIICHLQSEMEKVVKDLTIFYSNLFFSFLWIFVKYWNIVCLLFSSLLEIHSSHNINTPTLIPKKGRNGNIRETQRNEIFRTFYRSQVFLELFWTRNSIVVTSDCRPALRALRFVSFERRLCGIINSRSNMEWGLLAPENNKATLFKASY